MRAHKGRLPGCEAARLKTVNDKLASLSNCMPGKLLADTAPVDAAVTGQRLGVIQIDQQSQSGAILCLANQFQRRRLTGNAVDGIGQPDPIRLLSSLRVVDIGAITVGVLTQL